MYIYIVLLLFSLSCLFFFFFFIVSFFSLNDIIVTYCYYRCDRSCREERTLVRLMCRDSWRTYFQARHSRTRPGGLRRTGASSNGLAKFIYIFANIITRTQTYSLHIGFDVAVAHEVAQFTKLPFQTAPNKFEALAGFGSLFFILSSVFQ